MPNSFAGLAQRFPAEKEGQSLEEQVRELRDYSYQLLEYLRYALQHLDPSNFNEKEMEDWITKPIAAKIADVNGNLAQMQLTADQFAVRLQNAEGSISQVQQTATSLSSTVANQSNQISNLTQTATNISATVSGMETVVNDLGEEVEVINTTMVTVNSKGMIVDTNGKATAISGDCITTGTVALERLELDNNYGGLEIATGSTGVASTAGPCLYRNDDYYLYISSSAVRMTADDCDAYLSNQGFYVSVNDGDVEFHVTADGASLSGGDLWVDGTEVASSDVRVKNSMTYDLDDFEGMYRSLRPCRFKYNNGKSGRFHTGFIAQEVERAIADAGFADSDLAMVVQENHGTDDAGKYGIRYDEFVALNVAMIQKLMDENDALKARVAALEGGNDVT